MIINEVVNFILSNYKLLFDSKNYIVVSVIVTLKLNPCTWEEEEGKVLWMQGPYPTHSKLQNNHCYNVTA